MSERDIRKLELDDGTIPFDEWVSTLRDKRMEAAVDTRLARVRGGNFGDHKRIGGGVCELRIDIGPGLRVYYGEFRRQIVVLIGGGDKKTQKRDIRRAQSLWEQWLNKNNET
jgi:putative addiction module killer protein